MRRRVMQLLLQIDPEPVDSFYDEWFAFCRLESGNESNGVVRKCMAINLYVACFPFVQKNGPFFDNFHRCIPSSRRRPLCSFGQWAEISVHSVQFHLTEFHFVARLSRT